MGGVSPVTAWNTAASFTTNTNWQNYSGESTMGYLTQMAGLTVQNFVSAAVGLAIAIALIRGFTRSRTGKLGNFWVDPTRGTIRLLLPLAVTGGLILAASGVIENRSPPGEARRRGQAALFPAPGGGYATFAPASGDGAHHQRASGCSGRD